MRFFIAIILSLCATFTRVSACSCIWPDNMTVRDHFEKTDVIFRGVFREAHDIKTQENSVQHRIGKFEILEILKGDVPALANVYYVEENGANCGLSFETGIEYEVFAHIGADGRIQTSDCSGTRSAGMQDEWSWNDYREIAKK